MTDAAAHPADAAGNGSSSSGQVDPWLRGTLHIRFCQFFASVSLAAAVALLLTGNGIFIGVPGVLGVICLAGMAAEVKKRRMAQQAVRTMQAEGSWLYWQLPPQLWSTHARRSARKVPKMTLLLGLVGGFIAALVTVLPLLAGGEPREGGGDLRITAPDGRAFATSVVGLFVFIGLVIDGIQAIIDRAVARLGNVALVGPQGVIVGGEFLPLSNHFFLRFLGVHIGSEPEPSLEFHFREGRIHYGSGTGSINSSQGSRVLSLPIPAGWQDDAVRVQEALGGIRK